MHFGCHAAELAYTADPAVPDLERTVALTRSRASRVTRSALRNAAPLRREATPRMPPRALIRRPISDANGSTPHGRALKSRAPATTTPSTSSAPPTHNSQSIVMFRAPSAAAAYLARAEPRVMPQHRTTHGELPRPFHRPAPERVVTSSCLEPLLHPRAKFPQGRTPNLRDPGLGNAQELTDLPELQPFVVRQREHLPISLR